MFCGVTDPAEQAYAIKCTQICHCSAGPDTPQDLVPRGLMTRRICYAGVSDTPGKLKPQGIKRKSLKEDFSKIVCMY